jgi:TatD DNase family protein
MSILIDTHAHPLMIKEFYEKKNKTYYDTESEIAQWKKNNIKKIICISTQLSDYDKYKELSKEENSLYYFSGGIHPCDINKNTFNEDINNLEKKIINDTNTQSNLVAIGETGIDLYHEKDLLNEQKKTFAKHIEIAITYKLPLVIHTRNASQETFDILSAYKNYNITGVIHCFDGDEKWARNWLNLGFYLGVGGSITYPKNTHLRDILLKFGLSRIVLETDSPFLPPQQIRGHINTPLSIKIINNFISQFMNIPEKKCRDVFYINTITLFPKIINE